MNDDKVTRSEVRKLVNSQIHWRGQNPEQTKNIGFCLTKSGNIVRTEMTMRHDRVFSTQPCCTLSNDCVVYAMSFLKHKLCPPKPPYIQSYIWQSPYFKLPGSKANSGYKKHTCMLLSSPTGISKHTPWNRKRERHLLSKGILRNRDTTPNRQHLQLLIQANCTNQK